MKRGRKCYLVGSILLSVLPLLAGLAVSVLARSRSRSRASRSGAPAIPSSFSGAPLGSSASPEVSTVDARGLREKQKEAFAAAVFEGKQQQPEGREEGGGKPGRHGQRQEGRTRGLSPSSESHWTLKENKAPERSQRNPRADIISPTPDSTAGGRSQVQCGVLLSSLPELRPGAVDKRPALFFLLTQKV